MTQPFATRIPRDLVIVRGPDATSFLQSLVSQDLDAIAVGETARSLLLQPQGKLLVEFALRHHHNDQWWCLCERGFGSVLADGLTRFKIRVKVEIELRPVEVLAVRGAQVEVSDREVAIPISWNGVPAVDIVGDDVAVDVPIVDHVAYERARIAAGVPRMGVDIDERTIPQEAGLDADAVSFTKGCFVGQELVCRIDTRGHVNRQLRVVRSLDGRSLRVGSDVVADDRTVGQITSTAGDIALAMLRREVAAGAHVRIEDARAVVEPAH